jgi:hypothetical protein
MEAMLQLVKLGIAALRGAYTKREPENPYLGEYPWLQ